MKGRMKDKESCYRKLATNNRQPFLPMNMQQYLYVLWSGVSAYFHIEEQSGCGYSSICELEANFSTKQVKSWSLDHPPILVHSVDSLISDFSIGGNF